VSKAFTKEDGPDEPVLVRHRPTLPEGTPNYVTASRLRALRAELSEAPPSQRRLELERLIGAAVVAPPPADRDEIRVGARVKLRGADEVIRQVQLVGVDEADPAAGLIAFVAPLARALLGRRAGDSVTVRAPRGDEELEIVAVSYDDAG